MLRHHGQIPAEVHAADQVKILHRTAVWATHDGSNEDCRGKIGVIGDVMNYPARRNVDFADSGHDHVLL